jgi:LVIVD repeat-containing protein
MKRRLLVVLSLLGLVLALPLVAFGDVGVGLGGGTPGTSLNFQLVGHNDLSGFELDGNTVPRGMNSQVTIYGHYAYIGNRTDGSSTCGIGDPRRGVEPCPHPHPGILIADIADPTNPTVVGEIGPPNAGQVGITTRELRVWPQKKLLMVMTFRCSSVIHACPVGNDTTFPFDIKFFDLTDPVHPAFISSYVPTSVAGQKVKPHEMFLWVDPKNPDRALLWLSLPTSSVNPARPNLMIVDISDVPSGGAVREVAEGNWNQFFPGAADASNYDFDLALHSMTPSFDGTRTYLAYLRGGFGVLDTSEVAKDEVPVGTVESLNDKLLTPVPFPTWVTRRCRCRAARSRSRSTRCTGPSRPTPSAGRGAGLACGTSLNPAGRT